MKNYKAFNMCKADLIKNFLQWAIQFDISDYQFTTIIYEIISARNIDQLLDFENSIINADNNLDMILEKNKIIGVVNDSEEM